MTNRAKQWRKNRVREITFPSGGIAEVRTVSVTSMIMNDGSIPDTLYEFMLDGVGQNGSANLASLNGNSRETLQSMVDLQNQVARDAFVSPRIVDEPDYDNDEIHIDDVSDADKGFLLGWLMGGGDPADALARFLEGQQAGGMGSAQGMPGVLPASKPDDGD